MKLFNWMHRKSWQTHAHCIGRFCGESFDKQQDWYTKGRNHKLPSATKPATANTKPVQATLLLEQCFLDIQKTNAGQTDLADLLRGIQNTLLAIGTFGMSSLEEEEEMKNSGKMKSSGSDLQASEIEAQDSQNELENVLYTVHEDGQSKVESQHAKNLGDKIENESPQANQAQEYNDNASSDRKVQTGMDLFPLQEFLETPLEHATLAKKGKISHSFAHFLSWKRDANQKERIEWKVTDNPTLISMSPFLQRTLFKSKRPEQGELHCQSQSKLQKFLHIFRKRNTPRRSLDQGVIDEDDFCSSKDTSLADQNYGIPRDVLGDREKEVFHELESFRFQNLCGLQSDDLRVPKADNENWIKTDDEYVVLEL